ncbi:hypothetical protein FHE74_05940 [Corynebacterium tapiri]|uniref:FCS-type domain-containing protein n=1 Tax=Corynebacterium tapiri TaxID=1448266 RepID=A0A5C4U3L6_9CORY|nr:hypothetical protein [Corynebacterium tapiri]TNL97627.1 hypothetical protein FHE74_05940 [Corynebacterium tapiri]
MSANRATCEWCGGEVPESPRGRPRKYCRAACRQRAYEQRARLAGSSISPEAVIMRPEKVRDFHDGLFELRCAAEDIATAADEGASSDDLRVLCDELVSLARKMEKLR